MRLYSIKRKLYKKKVLVVKKKVLIKHNSSFYTHTQRASGVGVLRRASDRNALFYNTYFVQF